MARLSYALVTLGTLSIAAGIVILVYLDPSVGFPTMSGAQIWSGALMTVLGAVGIITSRTSENLKHDIQRNLKCKIGLFYGLSVSSMSICGIATGYTAAGAALCAGQDDSCAKDGGSLVLVLLSISVVLIVAMLVCGVCGMVFFCWYRNAFQMYTYAYRTSLLQQQVQNLQNQVNRGSDVNNYGGLQSGFAGQDNGGYTNWNATPPPAYKEKA